MDMRAGKISAQVRPDYEAAPGRPRRRFFTPAGWFLLSSFCAVYVLLGVFGRRRDTAYSPTEWVFLALMILVILATFSFGIFSARARRTGAG
jgi:hypothetical protein